MDKYTRGTSNNNGIHGMCNCFRGTCVVCAPSVERYTTLKKRNAHEKTKEGERTNE